MRKTLIHRGQCDAGGTGGIETGTGNRVADGGGQTIGKTHGNDMTVRGLAVITQRRHGGGNDNQRGNDLDDNRQRNRERNAILGQQRVRHGAVLETVNGRSQPHFGSYLLGCGQQLDHGEAGGDGTDDLSDHIEDAIQDFRLGNQHGGYGDGRIQLATGHAGEDGGDCGICQAGSQREEHDIDAIHGRTPCGEGVNGKAQQEAAGQFGAHAQGQRLLLGFFHDCSFLFICWKTGEPAQTVASLAAVLRCGMIYRLELAGIPVRQL